MSSSSGRDHKKRKADDSAPLDLSEARSPLSPVLSPPLRPGTRPTTAPEGVWPIENRYFYDNCLTLYEQSVESLNEAFRNSLPSNPSATDVLWNVCEYERRMQQLKEFYQCPQIGKVLTCGMSDMESLGYDFNTTSPKVVKAISNLNITKISCGSTFTMMNDRSGKVYSFGSQDEGGMGRDGDAVEGDLQVTGFIPHPNSNCPLANEDDCIIMVKGGLAKSLALSLHNNVYTMGCFRDYADTKLREKPFDIHEQDRNEKVYPKGSHFSPCHVYDMPPGTVTDMALGTWMAACIVGDEVVTWGVGTKGELGRPLPGTGEFRDQTTGKYDFEMLDKYGLTPTPVPNLQGKIAISLCCGQGHLMVVAREHGSLESTVYGSGINWDGQLGLGDMEDRKVLTPLEYTRTDNMMIAKVEAGSFHTVAFSLDRNHVYACGQAAFGQCGFSKEQPAKDAKILKLQPVPFPEDVEVESVECGELHTLVIAKPKGGVRNLYTWGSTVPMEDACCLGHGEADKSEYRPREVVLTKKDGTLVSKGVWRQAAGGAQHSAFVYTSAPKKATTAAGQPTARRVLQKIDH